VHATTVKGRAGAVEFYALNEVPETAS
jgi:hypothetical protein